MCVEVPKDIGVRDIAYVCEVGGVSLGCGVGGGDVEVYYVDSLFAKL